MGWRLPACVHGVCVAALTLLLPACSLTSRQTYDEVALRRTETELPPGELLSVGIVIFDPGLGKQGDGDGLAFRDVREAEARCMPWHLRTTLENSGYWGSVWVVPERSQAVDVTVWGRIDRSDGLTAVLRVGAWDATGREWLNRTYSARVPEKAYSRLREPGQDPYQAVYNSIANDLVAAREDLAPRELERIRATAELRYGADLVPAAFAGYLDVESDKYRLRRLPAAEDPMVARMRAVREREYTLVDTLNEYYAGLCHQLSAPYLDWRWMSREEMIRYQDLRRSAFIRGAAGLAAIIGAVLYEGAGGDNTGITVTGIYAGFEGIRSALEKRSEAGMSRESIRELGESFESEAAPLVVEVEGQTRRLQGTAEEKYREWRRLLYEIYRGETGLPEPGAEAPVAGQPVTSPVPVN